MPFLGTDWKDSTNPKEGEIYMDNTSERRFTKKAGLKLVFKDKKKRMKKAEASWKQKQ